MTAFVPAILWGWPLVVVGLFAVLPARTAVVAAFVGGWLFLPEASYVFEGLPNYDKKLATCLGVLVATLLSNPEGILGGHPRWADLPVLALIAAPFLTSVANGLGVYDGVSASFSMAVTWGLPYWLGRIYFGNRRGMRDLAVGVFIGGLLYMPLCWFEMRMSPQLAQTVYGFARKGYFEWARGGGYRPLVFLSSSLAVAMWMVLSSLAGFWLCWTGSLRRLGPVSAWWFAVPLLATALLIPSGGSRALMVVGVGALVVVRYWRTSLPVSALAAIVVAYVTLRAGGWWDGKSTLDWLDPFYSSERLGSWAFRVEQDEILAVHARERALFGWGRFGRNRPEGIRTITDTMWIIYFGTYGAFGLAAAMATALLPCVTLRWRVHPRDWVRPAYAASAFAAVAVCLWMCDNLSNSMFNPIYVLMVGGMAGLRREAPAKPRQRASAGEGNASSVLNSSASAASEPW